MEMLRVPVPYEPHALNDCERVSVRILIGVIVGVDGTALIRVAGCVAGLGSISAHVLNRRRGTHGVDWTNVQKGRFIAAGVVRKSFHAFRRALPNLTSRHLRLDGGLRLWRCGSGR